MRQWNLLTQSAVVPSRVLPDFIHMDRTSGAFPGNVHSSSKRSKSWVLCCSVPPSASQRPGSKRRGHTRPCPQLGLSFLGYRGFLAFLALLEVPGSPPHLSLWDPEGLTVGREKTAQLSHAGSLTVEDDRWITVVSALVVL